MAGISVALHSAAHSVTLGEYSLQKLVNRGGELGSTPKTHLTTHLILLPPVAYRSKMQRFSQGATFYSAAFFDYFLPRKNGRKMSRHSALFSAGVTKHIAVFGGKKR